MSQKALGKPGRRVTDEQQRESESPHPSGEREQSPDPPHRGLGGDQAQP